METIALESVKTLEWGDGLAKQLKDLRSPLIGRDALARQMEEYRLEPRCSSQYLQKIEDNRVAGVNRELLSNILGLLGKTIGAFYPVTPRETFLSDEQIATKSS